jgi:hypothetical protein
MYRVSVEPDFTAGEFVWMDDTNKEDNDDCRNGNGDVSFFVILAICCFVS